jgi:hypothetical protein
MEGCGARTPCRTARSNSADRVIRFRAGSIPRRLEFRQSACRGPCGAARSQLPGPHGSASASGNRGPWPAGGCSAGTSFCPWPRPFLLIASSCSARWYTAPSGMQPLLSKFCSNRRAPDCPVAAVPPITGDPLRVLRSLPQVKPRETRPGIRRSRMQPLSVGTCVKTC